MTGPKIHVYQLLEALARGAPGQAHRGQTVEAGGPLTPGSPVLVRQVAVSDVQDEAVLVRLVATHALARRIAADTVLAPVDHGLVTGDGGRRFWAASPWVAGHTVAEILLTADAVPDLLTESLVRRLAAALVATSAAGLRSLCVGPERILLRDDGTAVLLEPGLGPAVQANWPGEGTAPPSMLSGDVRSDLYALGCVLHRLMTGQWHRPDDAAALRRVSAEMDAKRPEDERPKCSLFLSELTFALLQVDPAARIQTPQELVGILAQRRRSTWWRSLGISDETYNSDSPRLETLTPEPALPPVPVAAPSPSDEYWAARCAFPDQLVSHRGRCVGREAEIAFVMEAVLQLSQQGGGALLVEGEAGTGKSRILDALIERIRELPLERTPVVLRGHQRRLGVSRPFGAFTEALTGWLARGRIVDPAELAPLLGEAAGMAEPLAAVLSSEPIRGGAAQLSREAVPPAFLRCLRTMTARSPVVLLIEDLQWSDPEVLDLHIAHKLCKKLYESGVEATEIHGDLMQNKRDRVMDRFRKGHIRVLVATDLPLLLVGTYRPEERLAAMAEPLATVREVPRTRFLRVEPFDLARLTHVAADVVGDTEVAGRIAAHVHATSGGLPAALVQTVLALESEGVLAPLTSGALALAPGRSLEPLPASQEDAAARRLGGLAPRARAFLEAASVQGVVFDADVARIATGLDIRTAIRVLDDLSARRLVAGEGIVRRFADPALHEYVQSALRDAALADRHEATAAAFLESRNPDQLPPSRIHGILSFRVAWHYLLSGRGGRGLLYVRAAVEHLRATFRNGDGERLVALACRVIGADTAYGADMIDLLIERARFLGAQRRTTEQKDALDEALIRSRERRDLLRESRVLLDLARAHTVLGDGAQASEDAKLSLSCAHRSGEADVEMRVRILLAHAAVRESRHHDARVHFDEALQIAMRQHDDAAEAEILDGLALVAHALGAFDQSEELYVDALRAHRRRGDLVCEAGTLAALGSLATASGDLARAEGCLRRAVAIHVALGDGHGEARALGLLAMVLQEAGNLLAAADAHRGCLERVRRLDARSSEIVALLNLATVQVCLGRLVEARDAYGAALRGAMLGDDLRLQGYALTGLGEVARQHGDNGVARDLLRRAEMRFRDTLDPSGLAAALLAAARLETFAGDPGVAIAHLREANLLAEQQNARQVVALAEALLALHAARRGDADLAERHIAQSGIALSDIRASDATRVETHFLHSLVLRVLQRSVEADRKLFQAEAHLLEGFRSLPDEDRDRVIASLSPAREICAGAAAARISVPRRPHDLSETMAV